MLKLLIFSFAYEMLYLGEGTAYVPRHAMEDDIFTLVLARSTTQPKNLNFSSGLNK